MTSKRNQTLLPFSDWQKQVICHALSELAIRWQRQHEKDNPHDPSVPASVRQVLDLELAISVHAKARKKNLLVDRLNGVPTVVERVA